MNIYIGNLSLQVSQDELRREFIAFGEVESITLMNDKYIRSGQPRGYAYVEMPSRLEGEAAISAINGRQIRKRTVNVIEALPLSREKGSNQKKRVNRYRGRERGK
ncbi:MAG: RNA-binding protein [Dehalococcoidia bacterium]|nr:MAG: RNA-binding protein [Dehalococcoidia bacterium]